MDLSFLSGGFASQLTSYFSLAYLALFLPITVVLYWLMPLKDGCCFLQTTYFFG